MQIPVTEQNTVQYYSSNVYFLYVVGSSAAFLDDILLQKFSHVQLATPTHFKHTISVSKNSLLILSCLEQLIFQVLHWKCVISKHFSTDKAPRLNVFYVHMNE